MVKHAVNHKMSLKDISVNMVLALVIFGIYVSFYIYLLKMQEKNCTCAQSAKLIKLLRVHMILQIVGFVLTYPLMLYSRKFYINNVHRALMYLTAIATLALTIYVFISFAEYNNKLEREMRESEECKECADDWKRVMFKGYVYFVAIFALLVVFSVFMLILSGGKSK